MRYSSLLLFVAIIILFTLSGCSSTMKCTVYGEPGTKLYTTSGAYIGTISGAGECELELWRKRRYDMLLAQQTPESPIVFMGLDYDKRNNNVRGAVAFTTAVAAMPLFWLPLIIWAKYEDNSDVDDCLKLAKHQTSNSDLFSRINAAANPIDEIKAYKPKEYKSGVVKSKPRKSNMLEPSLFNRTGEYSKAISLSMMTGAEGVAKQKLPFKGSVFFNFPEDDALGITIKISGFIGDNRKELKDAVGLLGIFKKENGKLVGLDVDRNKVILELLDNGNCALTYHNSGHYFQIEFDYNSFVEKEPEYDQTDMLLEMLRILN